MEVAKRGTPFMVRGSGGKLSNHPSENKILLNKITMKNDSRRQISTNFTSKRNLHIDSQKSINETGGGAIPIKQDFLADL
jgi:hypothetical protein